MLEDDETREFLYKLYKAPNRLVFEIPESARRYIQPLTVPLVSLYAHRHALPLSKVRDITREIVSQVGQVT